MPDCEDAAGKAGRRNGYGNILETGHCHLHICSDRMDLLIVGENHAHSYIG